MSSQIDSGDHPDVMMVPTMCFGAPQTVQVNASELYAFPDGLPGLPDSHRYALVTKPEFEPLRWLQSLDEAHLCLAVLGMDAVELGDYASQVVEVAGEDAIATTSRILLVTRFDEASQSFLANLMAPIVLDGRTATGRQVILEGKGCPLRQPLRWDAGARKFGVPC